MRTGIGVRRGQTLGQPGTSQRLLVRSKTLDLARRGGELAPQFQSLVTGPLIGCCEALAETLEQRLFFTDGEGIA